MSDDEPIYIPGHDHQRSSLDIYGTCDGCRFCDDCNDFVTIDADPHWSPS